MDTWYYTSIWATIFGNKFKTEADHSCNCFEIKRSRDGSNQLKYYYIRFTERFVYICKCTIQTYYMAKVTKKLAYGPREDFKQIIIGFSVYLKFNIYLGLKPGSIRSIFKYNCNKYKIMEYPVDLSND